MEYDLLVEIKKATQEYYSDPHLMSEFEVEQHIYDCICGLVEKPSYSEGDSQPGAVADNYSHTKLKLQLIGRRNELHKELKENDYSVIESVRYSKEQQLDSIDILLAQL